MDTFTRRTNKIGVLDSSLDVDTDSSDDQEVRPFSPASPGDNGVYFLPEITSDSQDVPSPVSWKRSTSGFREVEIAGQSREKRNKVYPVNELVIGEIHASPTPPSSSSQSPRRSARNPTDNSGNFCNSVVTESNSSTSYLTTGTNDSSNSSSCSKKHSAGLVLAKLPKEKGLVQETDTNSRKYGVTSVVTSGVVRPWANNPETVSEPVSALPIPKDVTKETLISSGSRSSSLPTIVQLDEDQTLTDNFSEDAANPINTICQHVKPSNSKPINPVSLATYNNIQGENGFKRGNCLLCTTAALTFAVTIVLTVAILIAPKSLASNMDPSPKAIVQKTKLHQKYHNFGSFLHPGTRNTTVKTKQIPSNSLNNTTSIKERFPESKNTPVR